MDETEQGLGGDDPRLDADDVRVLESEERTVWVVGTVHDHPASIYRVGRLVERLDPDVLALEVPPLAVPLYERYARDGDEGGEMSAAIRATDGANVVGIDLPRRGSLRSVVGALRDDGASPSTTCRVLGAVSAMAAHGMACRLAAVAGVLADRVDVERPQSHDCEGAPPAVQAEDERRLKSVNGALLRSFERPAPLGTFDRVREAAMARSVRNVDGDAVVVVGHAHVDPLVDRLVDPPAE